MDTYSLGGPLLSDRKIRGMPLTVDTSAGEIYVIRCIHFADSQCIHQEKIPELVVIYCAGRVVDLVICDNDFLRGIVNTCKCRKLSCVCFLFRHAVCYLNQINFAVFHSPEIDFSTLRFFICQQNLKIALKELS